MQSFSRVLCCVCVPDWTGVFPAVFLPLLQGLERGMYVSGQTEDTGDTGRTEQRIQVWDHSWLNVTKGKGFDSFPYWVTDAVLMTLNLLRMCPANAAGQGFL